MRAPHRSIYLSNCIRWPITESIIHFAEQDFNQSKKFRMLRKTLSTTALMNGFTITEYLSGRFAITAPKAIGIGFDQKYGKRNE